MVLGCSINLFLQKWFFSGLREGFTKNSWDGKWFPYIPGQSDSNPLYVKTDLHDSRHVVKMGVRDNTCDDAKV